MADNEREWGELMTTIEERVAYLEAENEDLKRIIERLRKARLRDDALTRTAAGQLRKVRHAQSVDDIKKILLEVAGNLEASGREGEK